MFRTHDCGELRLDNVNESVTLSGWVSNKREMGPFLFMVLYDRYGETQIVFEDSKIIEEAGKCSLEDVVQVTGFVRDRGDNRTDRYKTGDVEVIAEEFILLSKSKPMPYDHRKDTAEAIKLKYRYLDIRKSEVKNYLILRHNITRTVSNYLDKLGFLNIETPILTKSTPEGARDFLVPSRITKHSFYALPQSPQLFKQLLMVGGMDRYYQIAKCFRDEDLRADRQPEFTQIDIEMSFADEDDIMGIAENMIREVFREVKGLDIPEVPLMTYAYAMNNYGSDAPDTRYDMKLITLDPVFENSSFEAFKNAANDESQIIKGIVVEETAEEFSKNKIKRIEKDVQSDGAQGLAFIKNINGEIESPLAKFFSDEEKNALIEKIPVNGTMLLAAGKKNVILKAMGNLRKRMAAEKNLVSNDDYAFVWITEFPAFEYDEENDKWNAVHHPFTDFDLNEALAAKDRSTVLSRAYDLVINGHEVGGGSVRIHDFEKQKEVFKFIGISEEEAKEKFSFLLDGLTFGAPPHCGLAFGLDRLVMLLAGTEAIRDVIAFPKTTSASCLMSEAPSGVTKAQLDELYIKLSE